MDRHRTVWQDVVSQHHSRKWQRMLPILCRIHCSILLHQCRLEESLCRHGNRLRRQDALGCILLGGTYLKSHQVHKLCWLLPKMEQCRVRRSPRSRFRQYCLHSENSHESSELFDLQPASAQLLFLTDKSLHISRHLELQNLYGVHRSEHSSYQPVQSSSKIKEQHAVRSKLDEWIQNWS